MVDWACNPTFPSTCKVASELDALSGHYLFLTSHCTRFVVDELVDLRDKHKYDAIERKQPDFVPNSFDTVQIGWFSMLLFSVA